MDSGESETLPDLNKRVSSIFLDFMTKIAKFDEMVSASNKLLVGFHQQVELLRRPPLHKTSDVVDGILKANHTKRVQAYVQSGCRNLHDSIQTISKLNSCQQGLEDHLHKAKGLLNELKLLVEDLVGVTQTVETSTLLCQDELPCDGFLHQKEEVEPTPLRKLEIADYASMMGIIYSMLSKDYSMQEKIVTSLNLNSQSSELESYCLMWSLRPFMNDEVMQYAWRHIS